MRFNSMYIRMYVSVCVCVCVCLFSSKGYCTVGIVSSLLTQTRHIVSLAYWLSSPFNWISQRFRGFCLDGTCTRDPNMNLFIQYGLLGLVLVLGLGLGFILYCRIWRPWHYRTCAHSHSKFGKTANFGKGGGYCIMAFYTSATVPDNGICTWQRLYQRVTHDTVTKKAPAAAIFYIPNLPKNGGRARSI